MSDDALLAVNSLFLKYADNYQRLIDQNEISFATEYKNQFSKVVLLSCASYFESKITTMILDKLNTKTCELTYSFVSKKALKRQYHTLFSWESKNANAFFGLFGSAYSDFMKEKVASDVNVENGIKDFLELGGLRNKLVHENYATFSLQLTVEDIKRKFESTLIALEFIEKSFEDFKKSGDDHLTSLSS